MHRYGILGPITITDNYWFIVADTDTITDILFYKTKGYKRFLDFRWKTIGIYIYIYVYVKDYVDSDVAWQGVCVQLPQFSFQYDSNKFISSPIQWKSSWPYCVPNTFRVLKSSLFDMYVKHCVRTLWK